MKTKEINLKDILIGSSSCCLYCGGSHRMSVDHVIPVSWQLHLNELAGHNGSGRRKFSNIPTVHCCSSCNSTLNDKLFNTFEDRRRFAKKQLHKKAMKYDDLYWTPEQLLKIDYTLRTQMVAMKNKRAELIRRTYFFDSPEFLEDAFGIVLIDWSVFGQAWVDFWKPTIDLINNNQR